MIRGTVTDDGTPTILLPVAGRDWVVVIDTGFNGGLELPEPLRPHVNARFTARIRFLLAAGQQVVEDGYKVDDLIMPEAPLRKIGRAQKPSPEEVQRNPRSRSAVLRVAERTNSPLPSDWPRGWRAVA